MVGRTHIYTVLAVAVAVAYGVGVGEYWVTDMMVFAVVASAVAWFCFARGAKTKDIEAGYRALGVSGKQIYRPAEPHSAYGHAWGVVTEPDQREQVSRSRIAHYVVVSRIKSTTLTAWLRRESDSPFERALFSEPEWRTLSGESLEEISRKALDAPAKSAQ